MSFLVRRYVRVGLPLVIITAIAQFSDASALGLFEAVTWSVYAEIFYYSIYPILFRVRQRWGWGSVITTSSLAAVMISISHAGQLYLWSLGWLVWLWGLPVWVSGCILAEWLQRARMPFFPGGLRVWRFLVGLASIGSVWLVFHAPIKIGYQFSMLAFAPIAFFWLVRELTSRHPAWDALESWGAASYSLYLVHPVVLGVLTQHSQVFSASVDLVIRPSLVAIGTVAFYFLVEAPSHRLARKMARVLALREPGISHRSTY